MQPAAQQHSARLEGWTSQQVVTTCWLALQKGSSCSHAASAATHSKHWLPPPQQLQHTLCRWAQVQTWQQQQRPQREAALVT